MNPPAPARFLTDDEVANLTRPLRQPAAQRRFLERQGIPFVTRPDGTPAVRADFDQTASRASGPARPRFDSVRAPR
jgi:hypothetical protein